MKLTKILALFAIVTLFAGCDAFFEPENNFLTSGLGSSGGNLAQVQVTIGTNGRTILPTINGFSKYMLSAERAAGNSTTFTPSPIQMDGWGRIALTYGEWIITVTAYVNVNGMEYPAAKGSATLLVSQNYHDVYINVALPQTGGTGTFAYTVRYPASGTASVKLQPWPLDQQVTFTENANNNVPIVKNNVPSGIYFLTVTATAEGKTVIRNEIVHIYQQSTTNADFVFTKMDFGGSNLILSGTIRFLVNRVQPDRAYLFIEMGNDNGGYIQPPLVDFIGNDGLGTWEVSLNSNNLIGATTIIIRAGLSQSSNGGGKLITSIPIPIDDLPNINLGTVEFNAIPLLSDTWVDGEISTSGEEDYFSIDVTQGQTYFFWFNNAEANNGKSLWGDAQVSSNYNNLYLYDAWYDPESFIANESGTVYIIVNGHNNTGTYAIAYSTNGRWHYNSFPPTAVSLVENTWVDGEITTDTSSKYSGDWYSVNVTQGQYYYFWFNSGNSGDGSKTLNNSEIQIYNSDGVSLDAWPWWSGGFTANSTEMIYINVRSYNNNRGTYGLVYSTTNSIPEN